MVATLNRKVYGWKIQKPSWSLALKIIKDDLTKMHVWKYSDLAPWIWIGKYVACQMSIKSSKQQRALRFRIQTMGTGSVPLTALRCQIADKRGEQFHARLRVFGARSRYACARELENGLDCLITTSLSKVSNTFLLYAQVTYNLLSQLFYVQRIYPLWAGKICFNISISPVCCCGRWLCFCTRR